MKIGVGALIINDKNEILLLRRREPPEIDKWSIPGGEVEKDEAPDQALLREIAEELNVDGELIKYLGVFTYKSEGDDFECLSMLFQVRLKSSAVNAEPYYHSSLQWFSLDSVPGNLAKPAQFALAQVNNLDLHSVPATEKEPEINVVLVQPFFPMADKESLSLPLGLATIHSFLKQHGFTVKTYDCSLATNYIRFCRELPILKPQIVGIQFHSDMSLDWAKRACRFVRTKLPDTIVVAGGELATHKSREILISNYADLVVKEEGETTFLEIVRAAVNGKSFSDIEGIDFLDSSSQVIIRNPSRTLMQKLDDLPLPEIHDLSWSEYGQWTIFTSRGCPFKCTYCSSAAYWKHTIRYHSAERVVYEILRLVNEYGASDIYIADDTFTLNKKRVYDICRLLNESMIRIKW